MIPKAMFYKYMETTSTSTSHLLNRTLESFGLPPQQRVRQLLLVCCHQRLAQNGYEGNVPTAKIITNFSSSCESSILSTWFFFGRIQTCFVNQKVSLVFTMFSFFFFGRRKVQCLVSGYNEVRKEVMFGVL